MDFIEALKSLSIKVPGQQEYVTNEAQTRNAFVEPFLRALGYDPSHPQEVQPEFGANYNVPGVIKDRKVDYGILEAGKPIILVEVKHHKHDLASGYAQLAAYYAATEAQVAILCNGLTYRFYTDLEKIHIMDKSPFLELDMQNLKDDDILELRCLVKGSFNLSILKERAKELKYVKGIKQLLSEQMQSPDDDFAKFFFRELCPDLRFTGKAREDFCQYVQRSFREFVDDSIRRKLDALSKSESDDGNPQVEPEPSPFDNQIEPTPQELEGFAIIKSILHPIIDVNRIYLRDKQSYCGILLDNVNNKPLVRLRFNDADRLKLSVFDKPGNTASEREETIPISNVNEIYKYQDRITATLKVYEESLA